MNLHEMVQLLSPQVIVAAKDPARAITGGYASDLLSCVMAGAKPGNIWITLQGHPNIVAVATLLELAGIIVSENASIDEVTIQKAAQEGIPLFRSPLPTYSVVARLSAAGVAGASM